MPKKKFRDTHTKQKARFLTTARQLGYDESGKSFEAAMGVLVSPKQSKRASKKRK